jgi:hypothetical protein
MVKGIFSLLMLFVGSGVALALPENDSLGWSEYRNERFGFVMRYPAAVFASRRTSASGDGDLFETPDGKARLLVGALPNNDHFSPGSYQEFIARQSYPGLKPDYAPIRETWTVLSGTIGSTMIYEKAMFSCSANVINTFAMTYPVAERRFYDRIVEAVERTFRTGLQGCGRNASRF